MPQYCPRKRPNSFTLRCLNTAKRIKSLGVKYLDIGCCSYCHEQNLVCYMIKGYAKCNNCIASNMKYCDGYFSDTKFDSLKRQKEALKKSVKDQRAEVARLAAAAVLAFAALASAQEKEVKLDKRLDKLTTRQLEILIQEVEALDALDEIKGSTALES